MTNGLDAGLGRKVLLLLRSVMTYLFNLCLFKPPVVRNAGERGTRERII